MIHRLRCSSRGGRCLLRAYSYQALFLSPRRDYSSSPLLLRAAIGDDNHVNNSQEDILKSFANLDHGRSKRTGFPEAVFAEGKTPQQVASILDDMARSVNESSSSSSSCGGGAGNAVLATR